ncbi:MAG TPA: amino acid--tRNA ligase-related protein, partial [Kofleriaceae bacterium]|nr:amino acid--tRNA ligase-related protein [Kofleriaceae bacterium]
MQAARRRNLPRRARMVAALRRFFAERDFLEIEAPVRVRAPALELHLDSVPAGEGWWLITSPEFQMKRLLADGLPRIFSLGKCFRAGEQGRHHEVESTMLEWYRAGAGLDAILADTEELVGAAVEAVTGGRTVAVAGRTIDLTPPWDRLTMAEAMARHAGVTVRGDEPAEALHAALVAAGIDPRGATAWDDLFFTAF